MAEGRGWILTGAILDLIGAALVVTSLPEGGGRLAGGIAALIAGSLLVFQGVLRLSRTGNRSPAEPAAADPSDWRPEPALLQPPPRNVALTGAGKRITVFWGLMVAVVLVYVFFTPSRGIPGAELIGEHGVRTTAIIHDKVTREIRDEPSYYIYYNFKDQRETGVRSSVRVSARRYNSVRVGDSIEVVYLPEDPLKHTLPGISERGLPTPLAFLTLAFVGALLLMFESLRRRHKRLTSLGATAPARVESVSRRGMGSVYVLSYTVNGERRELRGSERRAGVNKGDLITVLYLPAKPSQAIIYRLSLYQAVQGG